MKKFLTIILISLFIITTFIPVLAQDDQLEITMDSLNGIIYRKTEQGFFEFFRIQVWTRLLDNATIKPGDIIKTAEDSRLTLNLGTSSKIELSEASIIGLGSNSNNTNQFLEIKKGRILVNSTLNNNPDFNLEIETPDSTLNTGQAILEIEVNKYRTRILIEQGEITLTEKVTLNEVDFTAGQLAVIEDDEIKKYERVEFTTEATP
jgi:hypothetical protein